MLPEHFGANMIKEKILTCLFMWDVTIRDRVKSLHLSEQPRTTQTCPYYSGLAEYVPVTNQSSAELNKKKQLGWNEHFSFLLLFVWVSVFKWPVLSECRLRVCCVPVRRPALPHAKQPCDLRLHGATGQSSPYCRTCDRRCGWRAPGGLLRAGEQWPWGGRKAQIDFFSLFFSCCLMKSTYSYRDSFLKLNQKKLRMKMTKHKRLHKIQSD